MKLNAEWRRGETTALRPEELRCAEVLSEYHRNQGHDVGEYREGPDPPDFFLPIDGTVYGVEVTHLMEKKLLARPGNRPQVVSRRGEVKAFQEWAKQVETEARRRGILRGEYVFMLRGDFGNFTRSTAITKAALNYLEATQHLGELARSTLWTSGPTMIWAFKTDGGNTRVLGSVWPSAWQSEVIPIVQVVQDLLRDTISEKTQKLAHVTTPLILVLVNAYPMADPPTYVAAAASVQSGRFSGIYLVENDQCFPLVGIG